ncbi:hypothetical protein SLEP1_g26031 [Rubroshorea leprosula]|uniref:Reverse transcriptase domain-containing protein n=1 Tax=Rubroshorea leprosula TaxID=152421 RepID=A0AAV5JV62_9ROSI|nr:hypothetical protein SLEP1_g26031 [Rubroshorea leprosula]
METECGDRGRYGNGKSTTGFKDFVHKLPAYNKGLLKQCVSFHFYNFPEDWGAKQLFFFIRRAVKGGRLWDIFIPSKRDKRGNRYGFARFLDARVYQAMKKQLENMWIGNRRVIFNPVEDRREERRRTTLKLSEKARWQSSKKRTTYEDHMKAVGGSRPDSKLTYAQCLMQHREGGKPRETGKKEPTPSEARDARRSLNRESNKLHDTGGFKYKKVIEATGTDKVEEKLMKCAVRMALSPSIIPSLPKIFFNEGFPSIKIVPMGGNLVLIDGDDSESIQELVDGNLEWVSHYFDRVKIWSPSDIAEERFVWARIQGLPLHAWTKENLLKIGNQVGKCVLVDEYTLSKECLDVARVLENWRNDPWWPKKVHNSITKSEVSSSESNPGDNFGEFECDCSNGPEGGEIQTPLKDVSGINYPDNLRGSKQVVEENREIGGTLSNQEREKQSEGNEDNQTRRNLNSNGKVPATKDRVAQEIAQFRSPSGSKYKAQCDEHKLGSGKKEGSEFQAFVSPIKSPNTATEIRVESMKLVTGTKRGKRRKARVQPINFGGEVTQGSLLEGDIVCNNRRIKEGMISEEAKKVLDLGKKIRIDVENREELILGKFIRMEERDKQGCGREIPRSGGVLCIWDKDFFEKVTMVEKPKALAIFGLWGEKKQKCCIVNVYASCNRNERMETWTELLKMIEEGEGFWCIAGDFNSVRSMEERRGRSEHSRYKEDLNEFIENAGLVDLPLTRRKFTWYKGDGSAMSRLDRFLLSNDLLNFWGDCCQVGLNRSISNHCPVVLKKINSDWGPKPFRALNCWDQHPDFRRVVEESWKSTEVRGWKGYVCKEKFKHLRNRLKIWNLEVFGNFEKQIDMAEAKIKEVDSKNEITEISEEDILLRREANINKLRKMIQGIHKDGSWVEEPNIVKQEVREYFRKIFQDEQWDKPKLDGLQFKQLTEEDRIWLERAVSAEEVKQAVWECGGDKSPGPDGFSFHLIRACWTVIEKDVVEFVQEFSRNGKLVLANRIKKVLPKVISGTQSAFLGGRHIIDDEMMRRLDFGEKWRMWIKECLQTASISILVNGSPTEEFKMERGIRQGDPIAPFLFLIVVEGLNVLIESAISKEALKGIDVGPFGMNISHLQFADDTVIMGKVDPDNIKAVKGILRWFELLSDLKINFNKSVLYSFNASDEWGRMVAATLNCKSGSLPFTYLGMPVGDIMCRRKAWKLVIDNFSKKLAVWKVKSLSIGGRVTLLKSVLSALPIYFMSIFRIPKVVLHDLVSLQRKFLWGYTEDKSKLAWLSWEKVCRNRSEGGLGVPNLDYRNIALLGKWWDRFGKEEGSLWKKVVIDKFYGRGSVWDINQTQLRNVSTLWRNIVELGEKGGTEPLNISFPRLFNLTSNKDALVMEVGQFSNDSWIWKNIWRHDFIGRERDEEQRIKEIILRELVLSSQPDQRRWSFDTANGYTVRKAYSLMASQNRLVETRICRKLWGKLIPSKINCFGWRLILKGLLMKAGILKRGIQLQEEATFCCICRKELEDDDHLFATCPKIQSLWMRCYNWWGISLTLPNTISLLCEAHSIGIKKWVNSEVWFLIFLVVAWSIWYTRNSIIHNSQQWDEDKTFDLIQRRTFAWIRGRSTNTMFPFFYWCNSPSTCVQEIPKR